MHSWPQVKDEMSDTTETAVLAGGCAWIMQQLLRHPEGVISTRTGFMGGANENPTEENNGGHAEVVEAVFDPARLSYRGLLEVFFQVHRPDLDEATVVRCTAPRSSAPARSSGEWPRR